MELNSTLVGVVIILLIFVPIGYLIVNAASGDKKVKKSVSKLSQSNGINLSDIEVIGSFVIGLDTTAKKLIFTSKKNLTDDFQIIDMAEIKTCQTKTIMHNKKTLDWVGLELMGAVGRKEIPFYVENDEDAALSKDPFVCLQDAKKWEGKLKPYLKAS